MKEQWAAVKQLAESGCFEAFLNECLQMADSAKKDPATLIDLGVLLSDNGFLSQARECFEQAQALNPGDLRAMLNLANIARDMGAHRIIGDRPRLSGRVRARI